jgi:hypothetical protein
VGASVGVAVGGCAAGADVGARLDNEVTSKSVSPTAGALLPESQDLATIPCMPVEDPDGTLMSTANEPDVVVVGAGIPFVEPSQVMRTVRRGEKLLPVSLTTVPDWPEDGLVVTVGCAAAEAGVLCARSNTEPAISAAEIPVDSALRVNRILGSSMFDLFPLSRSYSQ